MHLRYLKVFCDVVEHRSFSKAAAANGMTQSGVSQVVQQLEEHVGAQLLDRSKRPFLLTPEGSVFHFGCQRIVREFDSLVEEIRAVGNDVSGTVSIAAIYSIGLSYLPELQKRVRDAYPNLDVRFRFCHPDEVYRQVEQGTVDFGLVSYPQASASLSAELWRVERMALVAPADHPLAHEEEVPPERLRRESLVAFAPKLRIRHEIDRYLRQLGVTMQIAAELDNIDSVRHALEVNSAVAFLPEPSIRDDLADGTLVALPCPWLELERPLGLVLRKDEVLGKSARCVMELLLDRMAESTVAERPAEAPNPTPGEGDRSLHLA
ncbi:MAG: LysR family transcriptional regulator [Planctomycetota bacterium]|nr:MAG: LysR family transcriptional regulator [Planctomycetota bacterium]